MTITREEFKQLVNLFIEVNDRLDKAVEFINEERAYELAFPVFDWIEKQLKIDSEHLGEDMLWMVSGTSEVAINEKYDEERDEWSAEYTRDLDKIYDYYFKDRTV